MNIASLGRTKVSVPQALGGLALVALLGFLYLWKVGLYPRYFDLEWDEEVLLHDGRVALVHLKSTYQRRDLLSRYDHTTFRVNELTFDSGQGLARTTLRSRLGIGHLDQIEGAWYAVFYGQGPFGYSDERADAWGRDFTVSEQRLARLEDGRFLPVAWDLAPPGSLVRRNRIVSSAPLKVLATFHNRRMTLIDKERLRTAYPPGPGGGEISRPIRMRQSKSDKT